jgi:hypothetical protein
VTGINVYSLINYKKQTKMKQTKRSLVMLAVVATLFIALSSFFTVNKTASVNVNEKPVTSSYAIDLVSVNQSGSNFVWTWTVANPNPGNGNNGTLQDVSHWDMPLSTAAEAALLSAEYSVDGVNWTSTAMTIERDPSIKFCTGVDVLKFDFGTSGSTPTYYRVTLNSDFSTNQFAQSWIKTGGGQEGCNAYFFAGIGSKRG